MYLDPFIPENFSKETGLQAHDNPELYIKWVNMKMSYSINQNLKNLTDAINNLTEQLKIKE